MLLTKEDIKEPQKYPKITFRVTPEEEIWLRRQAHKADLKLSKWLKKQLFQPDSTYNPIPELNGIITALNLTEPDTAKATAIAQQAIQNYIGVIAEI